MEQYFSCPDLKQTGEGLNKHCNCCLLFQSISLKDRNPVDKFKPINSRQLIDGLINLLDNKKAPLSPRNYVLICIAKLLMFYLCTGLRSLLPFVLNT